MCTLGGEVVILSKEIPDCRMGGVSVIAAIFKTRPVVSHPRQERVLFDLRRVDAYLAPQTWLRTVSAVGQVTLGGYRYGLGTAWATQTVSICFDPQARHFVFTCLKPHAPRGRDLPTLPAVRRAPQGLTVETLTDLPVGGQEGARLLK
jgi:hypothetical protein